MSKVNLSNNKIDRFIIIIYSRRITCESTLLLTQILMKYNFDKLLIFRDKIKPLISGTR